jgi:hypothetical protein
MSSQYAGDPDAFPSDFTIPDDGDAQDASSVNVAFEALGDRTAYLATKGLRVQVFTFNASGTFNAPANAAAIALAEGCGGGGGGGGGRNHAAADTNVTGGGGGGGALRHLQPIVIVPGGAHAVVIGDGGDGGPAEGGGNNGEDTTLANPSAVELLRFPGAQAGANGHPNVGGASSYSFGEAGAPNRNALDYFLTASTDPASNHTDGIQGHGGHGVSGGNNASTNPRNGSPQGSFVGGAPGTPNMTSSGSYRGGGCGGGGGAGGFGDGGDGGDGGAPNNAGAAGNGADGTAGGANTGAGGGGGGSSGASTTSGTGGAGGAGGSGRLKIYVLLSHIEP